MHAAVSQIGPNAIPSVELLSTKGFIVNDDTAERRLSDEERDQLAAAALRASGHAYAPYSRFRVGAALLLDDGTIVRGANVENRSYGLGICAERSAIVSAVSAGHTGFRAIAVCSPDAHDPISPCGACRQVMTEFMGPECEVIFVDAEGRREIHTVGEIMPFNFTLPGHRPVD